MLYLESVRKEETYGLNDVFGRSKIYYPNSTDRIWGWETPVSVIYRDRTKVKLRFKKCIKSYGEDFSEVSFEEAAKTEFFINKNDYMKKQEVARLKYAVGKYKESREKFECNALTPRELEQILDQDDLLMEREYLLSDDGAFLTPLYDSDSYWFAVDVDCIISDFSNREAVGKERAVVSFWSGEYINGSIGFDGKFYNIGFFFSKEEKNNIFDIKNGLNAIEMPAWLQDLRIFGVCKFLREYIITPDNFCFDYEGVFLENKTQHHQNVAFLNEIIHRLRKLHLTYYRGRFQLQATLPDELKSISIDDIENILVPHLASKKALNKNALKRFLELKAIIKKAGVQEDFVPVLRNIFALNACSDCGGSRLGICSEKLMANLKKLLKSADKEKSADLFMNFDQLREEVARINKSSKKDDRSDEE